MLDLFSGDASLPMPAVTGQGWAKVRHMAAEHRIQPLLHHKHRENDAIPAEVRAEWKNAFRESALSSLLIWRELVATNALLKDAGFAPVALKGAWLAWHAYPQPALRPMRDIDLLLTPETVVAAFDLLRTHGYEQRGDMQISLDNAVLIDKHMPPLVSPGGVAIELHQRLWEVDGRMDHAAPTADERAIRGRAIQIGDLAYVHPQDLLAHLIIHAVYDHRLDCGPLVLTDIEYLLRCQQIDWARFWGDARAQRWLRGAVLVLALVKRHFPEAEIPPAPCDAGEVSPDLVELFSNLMLQEMETRQSAGVAATLATGGWKAVGMRLLARRRVTDNATVGRNLSGDGGFVNWAGTRLFRTARDLARADVRHQSIGLSRLSKWLDD